MCESVGCENKRRFRTQTNTFVLITIDVSVNLMVWHTTVTGRDVKNFALVTMMTSSNGNIFRATGHLCGKLIGQWRGALMFSLICAWWNGWVNNREADVLRRHRAHYDVTVMTNQRSFRVLVQSMRTTLHYNVVSHWLSPYPDWSLQIRKCYIDLWEIVICHIWHLTSWCLSYHNGANIDKGKLHVWLIDKLYSHNVLYDSCINNIFVFENGLRIQGIPLLRDMWILPPSPPSPQLFIQPLILPFHEIVYTIFDFTFLRKCQHESHFRRWSVIGQDTSCAIHKQVQANYDDLWILGMD